MRVRLTGLCLLLFLTGAACSSDPAAAARKYIKSGDEYMQAGQYAEAGIEFANAVRRDTGSGEARFKLAEARLAAGDKRGAFPEFIRAADLLKDDNEAQLRAGHLLLQGGFFQDARERARIVLKRDPRNTVALVMLGNSLAALKDLDDAISVLERALKLDPEAAGIHANLAVFEMAKGNLAAAEAAFKEAVRVSHGGADAELGLGNFYLAVKRLREAEATLTAARQKFPTHLGLNRALASLYVQTDRLAEAEASFKTVAGLQKDAASRIGLAAFYQWANRDAEAVATLNALASEPAHFAEARSELAQLHFRRARLPEANAAIDEVLARNPRDAKAMTLKARLLLAGRRPTEALDTVTQAINIDGKLADAQLLLGRTYLVLRNLKAAAAAFHEAIALEPESIPARLELSALHLQDQEIETAIQLADEAVNLSRHNLAARLALVRALVVRSEDRARAEHEVQTLLAAYPRVAAVRVAVATVALSQDDASGARRAFDLALQLDPESVEAITGLITLDIKQNQPLRAQERAEALAARRPNDSGTLLLVANVYGFTGKVAKTESTLKLALKVDPSNPAISSLLGALYMRQNRVDEAIREFEDVAKLQPRSVGAATLLGLLYYAKNDRSNAEKWWSRAITVDARAAAASNNLAWLYAEKNEKLDVALQLAMTARNEYPQAPEVLDTVGWVYYRKKMSSMSLGYFEQSISLDPRNPLYHYHLGKAYVDRGEDARARRSLEQALTLDPHFPQAPDARKTIEGLLF